VLSDEIPADELRLATLLAALAESVTLLRERGDAHWADWLECDRVRIADCDAYGLEHLKQAFDGRASVTADNGEWFFDNLIVTAVDVTLSLDSFRTTETGRSQVRLPAPLGWAARRRAATVLPWGLTCRR
jgi:hypothetical protein